MKQILLIRYLIVLSIAFFVENTQSQSILFESKGGALSVNGNVIAPNTFPSDLEFGDVQFSLRAISSFPMRIEINGTLYDVWENRITKAETYGNPHYRISIGADGSFVSVESSTAPDLHDLTNALLQHMGGMFSSTRQMSDSLTQMISESEFILQDPNFLMSPKMTALQQGATRLLEFSNYLTNVRDTSGELFELLQHESRKEAEAVEMARRIGTLAQGDERDAAIKELEETLEEIFLMKQENRRMEIQHLEMQLDRMEEQIRERSRAKHRLIDARLNELLGN